MCLHVCVRVCVVRAVRVRAACLRDADEICESVSFLAMLFLVEKPVSCGQRLLWALAGSGITAVAMATYCSLVLPMWESLLVTNV